MNVVVGAGPLGLAVARALVSLNRPVRVVCLSGRAPVPPGVELAAGDATDPAGARRLCRDAAVVYHCASARYPEWPSRLPPIMSGILEGAAAAAAKFIYGDNLYMYGPVSGPLIEDLPYRASGPNGRVRAQLAEIVMDAHESGRVRAAIGRGADFFGPHVRQSGLGDRVFPAALAGRTAQVLGNPDVLHTYTFVDDFARGLVTLGDRDEALGSVWHVPSAPTMTTREIVTLVFRQTGMPPRISAAPKWAVALMASVNPLMRAVKEQLYQFERPFVVDHSKFDRAFGASPTPHEAAIARTLEWYRTPGHEER